MKSWFIHRSVLLAIAIFFQAEGMLLINTVQQFFHGLQMSKELKCSHSQFQILSLPVETYLQSRIKDHEISLNGEMYDVKSVDLCQDTAILLVLHDQKEENLLEKIGDYFRMDKPDNKTNPVSLYQLLTEKYIAPAQSTIVHSPMISKYAFAFLSIIRTISIPDLPGPPPKLN